LDVEKYPLMEVIYFVCIILPECSNIITSKHIIFSKFNFINK
jgi:hypothetical protein